MSDKKDDGFLSGWSRRKLAAKAPEPEEVDAPDTEATAPEQPAEVEDPDLVAALPSLDDITADFDIKPFLAKGVPAKLKNAAMRRLWLASPSVRDYADPAVDYAWDWNAPGGVPGGGGILSEQSVAKMVKDLIGTRETPVDESEGIAEQTAAVDPTSAPPDTDSALEDAETDAPPEPVRRTMHARTPDAQVPEQPAPKEVTPAPPRRHGGAVPD